MEQERILAKPVTENKVVSRIKKNLFKSILKRSSAVPLFKTGKVYEQAET